MLWCDSNTSIHQQHRLLLWSVSVGSSSCMVLLVHPAGKVVNLESAPAAAVKLDDIKASLAQHKPAALFLCQVSQHVTHHMSQICEHLSQRDLWRETAICNHPTNHALPSSPPSVSINPPLNHHTLWPQTGYCHLAWRELYSERLVCKQLPYKPHCTAVFVKQTLQCLRKKEPLLIP